MAPAYYILFALPCTIGAIALAIVHIYRHLLNYTEPTYQRYIVRIIFMVPVNALMSFLSLLFNDSSIYFNSIREVYEAWVIYNFLSLCLAWVGGPGAVVLSLSGRVLKPNWCLMTCCFPPIPLDGRFIRRCKQGCLQFVILKPILVAVTFVLYAKGKYHDGNFSVNQSYLYLTIIYTISYSVALYALALFYVACKDLLQPFNPVPKFIIIKSVVFLTYWQGVLVFLAAKSGFIKDAEDAAEFQSFIICVEMLIAAVGHLYAFPYKEYAGANIGPSRGFMASLAHALKLTDFYHDTVHQGEHYPWNVMIELQKLYIIFYVGTLHEFKAGDGSHSDAREIYAMLGQMKERLELEEGYSPNTSPVFFYLEEGEKETSVWQHSEKLAISFGLIASPPGATIRVMNNLRVCEDCHSVSKLRVCMVGK